MVYEPVRLNQEFRKFDFLSPWEGADYPLPGDEKAEAEGLTMNELSQNLRNFTINFGPQHPAAHGVLRLVLELDGEVVERVDPHIGLLASRHREADRAEDLSAGDPVFRPARLRRADEPGARVLPRGGEAARHRRCRAARQLIRVLYCEIGRILSHLLNVTTQAMDVGALTPPLWGFEEREKLMVFYERASGCAHARGVFPHRRRASGPAAEADRRHRRLVRSVPAGGRRSRNAADRQPHLQAAQRRHRRGDAGAGLGVGLLRRDGARLRRGLGSAQGAALRVLRRDGFRHSDRQERRLLRPLLHPHGRDAPVGAHHEAVHRQAARAGRAGAGRGRGQQDRRRRAAAR